MYKIIFVDGIYRASISKQNRVDKYGEPRLWKTKEEAEHWIERHSYKGMSFHYEIKENL